MTNIKIFLLLYFCIFISIFSCGEGPSPYDSEWQVVLSGPYDEDPIYNVSYEDVQFFDELNGYVLGFAHLPRFTSKGSVLRKTTDGGFTWQTVLDTICPDGNRYIGMYFVDSQNGWVVGTGGFIKRTTDGGLSWEEQNSKTVITLLDVFFIDANEGWVVGDFGTILHTTNGGITWSDQRTYIIGAIPFQKVYFVDPYNGWIIPGTEGINGNGYILHTSDGGNTWEIEAETNFCLRDIFLLIDGLGWAVGSSTEILFYCASESTNWDLIQTANDTDVWYGIHFPNIFTVWIVGTNGKIMFTNDCKTWQSQLSNTNSVLYDVFFINNGYGWAVSENGTILRYAPVE